MHQLFEREGTAFSPCLLVVDNKSSLLRNTNRIKPQNFTPDVKERASIYVPAIGKVTIVMLLRNLVRLVQNRPLENGTKAE